LPVTVAATLGEELLFLGHKDTSISAWQTDLKQKSISLARVMRGHGLESIHFSVLNYCIFRNVITSLRCLPEYGVLISGCKNGRVNIWDVSTLKLIRLLGVHSGEITDLKACLITGDIFVASSRQISVYSINGDPLGRFFYDLLVYVFLGSVKTEKVSCIGAPAGRVCT
jgi:WD40 repeat protein